MTTNVYAKGQLVRCKGVFTDINNALVDPTTVKFKTSDPNGVITILTYGTDNALVRDSTGNYHVDVDAEEAGTWYYRFESTGVGQAASEDEFYVDATRF